MSDQIDGAVAFVAQFMRPALATRSPRGADAPYDLDVVDEAIVNAFAHRDYAISGSKIRLFVFADRIELYSPGGLPNTITLDELPYRTFTRNQLLVGLLSRIRSKRTGQVFLESRGEGVRKNLEDGEAHSGRRPEYALFGHELRLTLWAKGTRWVRLTSNTWPSGTSRAMPGSAQAVVMPRDRIPKLLRTLLNSPEKFPRFPRVLPAGLDAVFELDPVEKEKETAPPPAESGRRRRDLLDDLRPRRVQQPVPALRACQQRRPGRRGSTSIPGAHRLIHWNLPGNPVDLEQREGRIHRYKGSAPRSIARFGAWCSWGACVPWSSRHTTTNGRRVTSGRSPAQISSTRDASPSEL